MFCPRQKNNLVNIQNLRYIGIFMSLREREKERQIDRERERERERGRGRERDRQRERERDKEEEKEQEKEKEGSKVQAIIYLNRPGQDEKPTNYIYFERAVQFEVNNPQDTVVKGRVQRKLRRV